MADEQDDLNERDDLNEQYAPYVVSPLIDAALDAGATKGLTDPLVKVIIDPNLDFPGGRDAALRQIRALLKSADATPLPHSTRHHVFARLTRAQLEKIVAIDRGRNLEGPPVDPVMHAMTDKPLKHRKAIFKIWRDTPLEAHLDRSIRAVKADACIRAFGSEGRGITWGVIDSGIDESHPHFKTYQTLDLEADTAATTAQAKMIGSVDHKDFTGGNSACTDVFGHGTHVAGIIAGATPVSPKAGMPEPVPDAPGAAKLVKRRAEDKSVRLHKEDLDHGLTGVAPRCKLVSLKVLDDAGTGDESALLAALDYVDELNADGQRIRVHGVNISIGYPFEAEWFAAGQSPVCVAVNRLVSHGVVVVCSAGNEGSVLIKPEGSAVNKRVGLDQSISDPGNAAKAITVGSTHPESPHTFGVSYFSSRGPTADGRAKPDLVAPGERIVSCASADKVAAAAADIRLVEKFVPQPGVAYYREESGTSMAAPHVSGACAAFLSVHKEFIGQPDEVKAALVDSATDLKRKRDFQGAGLLDLLRAIQSR